MRRGLAILVSAGLLAAVGITVAGSASAQDGVPGQCPEDFFMPIPATLVQSGAQKDHNDNGWLCAKPTNDGIVGGPDDEEVVDDVIPLP
jgi:hypothetical protein